MAVLREVATVAAMTAVADQWLPEGAGDMKGSKGGVMEEAAREREGAVGEARAGAGDSLRPLL